MKKLYGGLTAAALAAAGLACVAGPAGATTAGPSTLNYTPGYTTSVVVSAEGTAVYSVSIDDDDDTVVNVGVTTLASGTTAAGTVTIAGDDIDVDGVAVDANGTIVLSGRDGDGDPVLAVGQIGPTGADVTATAYDATVDGSTVAISPDGAYAAVTDGDEVQRVSLGPTVTVAPATELSTDEGGWASASGLAVATDGTILAAGEVGNDDNESGRLWRLPALDVPATSVDLTGDPDSVAMLGDGTVAVGLDIEGDVDDESRIAYVDGNAVTDTVDVDGPIGDLTANGQTLWATRSGSSQITRIDGSSAQTYNANYGEIWGTAAAADGKTLYLAGAAWIDGGDSDGEDGPASLFTLTAPGAPTDVNVYPDSGDAGSIDLGWTPAPDATDDDYVVTLTDQAAPHQVITATQYSDNVNPDYTSLVVSGIDQTHRYDVQVQAFNGAFYSTALTGQYLPAVPGNGVVSVDGAATVGSTLTGTVAGWPSTATLSYQWQTIVVHGESGGPEPIPGATGPSLTLTPALLGQRVLLEVTAHEDTYADGVADSTMVGPIAAAQSGQQPTQPTQPAKVGSVKAATMKSSSKRLTLKLTGVTSAPGKVKVYDGKKLVGTAKIKNGKLKIKLKKRFAKGKHQLKLKYAGSSSVAAFNKSVTVKVG